MSDQIAIEQGQLPWSPAAGAEFVRTLHVYDMPLIGVIRQGGSLHLYADSARNGGTIRADQRPRLAS